MNSWIWHLMADRLTSKWRRCGKFPYTEQISTQKGEVFEHFYNYIEYFPDRDQFAEIGIRRGIRNNAIRRRKELPRAYIVREVWSELDEAERKSFMASVLGASEKGSTEQ